MRKLFLGVILLLGYTLPSTASPITVDLTLESVAPNYNDGRVYVYPYNFLIKFADGSTTEASLVCDDYIHDVFIGESWKATAYEISDILLGAGQMSPNPLLQADRKKAYEEAAWLYQQLRLPSHNNNTDAVDINHTIWALFTATSDFVVPTTPGSWFAQAEAAICPTPGNCLTDEEAIARFSDIVIYTPIANSQSPDNYLPYTPQEFIGTKVPEPSSLLLIGMGLIGIAFLKRH